jgi:hypothetical protein
MNKQELKQLIKEEVRTTLNESFNRTAYNWEINNTSGEVLANSMKEAIRLAVNDYLEYMGDNIDDSGPEYFELHIESIY